ncbi:MAG TPA: hypothetical protein VJZ75_05560 [Candidatus Bathyarchaeia archaeon]|nr:hypothetical protein [Candidatus Bathyarchaeia archaeon]
MKPRLVMLVLLAAVIASLLVNPLVYAQSSQAVGRVSLVHLNVQLTYPSDVLPGQSVSVGVLAQAKGSFQLASLTMQVYYVDPQLGLRQVASAIVAQGLSMANGGQLNKAVQVTIPTDAPRTSLIARVAENVTLTVFIVYNNGPSTQAAPYYSATSDDAIAPLTYIMSPTPEYVALQSQYQTLESQYQQVRQGLNQSLVQNVKLQQAAQSEQAAQSQMAGLIAHLQGMVMLLESASAILGVAFVALAVVCLRRVRK